MNDCSTRSSARATALASSRFARRSPISRQIGHARLAISGAVAALLTGLCRTTTESTRRRRPSADLPRVLHQSRGAEHQPEGLQLDRFADHVAALRRNPSRFTLARLFPCSPCTTHEFPPVCRDAVWYARRASCNRRYAHAGVSV